MSHVGKMIPKFAICRCGAILPLTQRIIKCGRCGLLYEYHPEKIALFTLEFQCGDNPLFSFQLFESVIIGRDGYDRNYIKIRSMEDRMKMENTYIRNIFISRDHVAIHVEEEMIVPRDGQEIIVKKKCKIEDLGSKNGTEINGIPLRPGMQYELKHNDIVILAPKTLLPLTITLKEKIINEQEI